MGLNINQQAFITVVQGGLWEKDIWLPQLDEVDFKDIYRFAQEQSVVGLATAGIERLSDIKFPQSLALQFVSDTLQLEQRNKAMNVFVKGLFEKLYKQGVCAILVKGQGIAQCYERPLWRASGDVDLFLSREDYIKAKELLLPLATMVDGEEKDRLHISMTIENWEVELHGTLHCGLSKRVDSCLDNIQQFIFEKEKVRTWQNEGISIRIPDVNEDVIIIFTHILQHFFNEGIGLRQICDWMRFLWVNEGALDKSLLERRLEGMGLVPEWKSFAAYAVDYLGMPDCKMPLYDNDVRWKRKAEYVNDYIMKVGNFGRNIINFKTAQMTLLRKLNTAIKMGRHTLQHVRVFPRTSLTACLHQINTGLRMNFKLTM